MIRTILMTGVFAMLGLLALSLVFNIFGALIGIAVWLLVLTIKIAIIGAIAYVAIRIISPDTARRLRDRWSGNRISSY